MPYEGLEELISIYSLVFVGVSSFAILILSAISLILKNPREQVKRWLFYSILSCIILTTVFLASSTLYLNYVSKSAGPVHWHADIEIWACGEEISLKDPKGLSNKIGTATLHEHNDKRIHLEGVVVVPKDASLGKFFRVIGGMITSRSMTVPATDGIRTFISGNTCPNGKKAELQVFVYSTKEGTFYSQQKLVDPSRFTIAEYSSVPAGNCIIVEFDEPKAKTDKLCRSYKVAESLGKIRKTD